MCTSPLKQIKQLIFDLGVNGFTRPSASFQFNSELLNKVEMLSQKSVEYCPVREIIGVTSFSGYHPTNRRTQGQSLV